jgi:ribonuclease BN (tRNA processing enzyme)
MKLRVVDGSHAAPCQQANLISYVVDDRIAFDAGAIGLLPLAQQKQISKIFLSHVHADHIASLPVLVDNVFSPGEDCIQLYASEYSITQLQRHVFNDVIWPDVVRLAREETTFCEFKTIEAGHAVEVDGYRITAFEVNHTIPTLGFVIEDQQAAIALVSDTSPMDSIWQFLDSVERLKAVLLEISFPNSLHWLAEKAKHLTPQLFSSEIRKLSRDVDWLITHVKPEFAQQVAAEVAELELPKCQFALSGTDYIY